ncbi:aminodeoxychorismate synthase component I [Photorhabdus sp. CRCIA-P01]|uniref:aminodeoxychorismate synthase component I n=1 Tax=Photorhabdus sp. CRCIA-P01 TaxID=2019570 RepID=UPI001E61FA94|nr:aminodeoxychorismate synthase component I [Photorhabdus sp. CRCIA-P01]
MYRNELRSFESTFWLDSELCERPGSRYSVMGRCNASVSLVFSYEVASRKLTMKGPSGSTSISGDFFELMDQLLETIEQSTSGQIPFPFQAGVVGYLGYELKGLKQNANLHRSSYPDALLYLPQNYFVFDHQEHKSWLCNVWGPSLSAELMDENASNHKSVSNFEPGPAPLDELTLEDSPQEYMDKIETCLEEIRNGESYEICLTNRVKMQFDQDPLEAYCRMRHISPVPYGAFLKNRDFAVLSASPEKFLTIETDRKVRSKPIKGTRPRSADLREDDNLKTELAQSRKDRAENLMIVDLVRHDLNSICVPGSVEVPLAFDIESYSSVHQLVSTVEGKLPATAGTFQAIKACFPGGSMTGAPKIRTMEIIDRLERSPRGIYAGAIGWVGLNGYADLSIVIRTAVIRDGMAEFGIGGAIVADSNPEKEMTETLVKASVPFQSLKFTKKVRKS